MYLQSSMLSANPLWKPFFLSLQILIWLKRNSQVTDKEFIYHTQRFSKQQQIYPIFQVLISKSCCLSLGVLACCIAPGNLLYSDARLMRLLDEVGSQSLTLRSQCAEAGDWALTSVPRPHSTLGLCQSETDTQVTGALEESQWLVTLPFQWFIDEMTPKEVTEGWLHCCQLLDKTSERWVRSLPMLHCPIYC